jgi:importin subunit alpha-6/7
VPHPLTHMQVEALWALTNIAAGTTEHTNMLLRHNPVPALVGLLESPNDEVLEQAVWVLGNIAGEVRPPPTTTAAAEQQ